MHTKNKTALILLLIALLFCLGTTSTWAIRPRSTVATIVIQRIDMDLRVLTIKNTDINEDVPTLLEWKDYTKFIEDNEVRNVKNLRAGTHAVIWYRAPLLGKPFVTRVIWKTGNDAGNFERKIL